MRILFPHRIESIRSRKRLTGDCVPQWVGALTAATAPVDTMGVVEATLVTWRGRT
jgi:hypothetical protein